MSYLSPVVIITFGLKNFDIGNLNIGFIFVEKNTPEKFRQRIGSNFHQYFLLNTVCIIFKLLRRWIRTTLIIMN